MTTTLTARGHIAQVQLARASSDMFNLDLDLDIVTVTFTNTSRGTLPMQQVSSCNEQPSLPRMDSHGVDEKQRYVDMRRLR